MIKYNFSISCFKISDDSSQSYRRHSSSSSSSVSLSSLSSIDFSSINSQFSSGPYNAAVRQSLTAIGMRLSAVSNAHQYTEILAASLIELLRAFTNGDGQSSSSSSNNELINKYSSILMSNKFNSSKSKKNIT